MVKFSHQADPWIRKKNKKTPGFNIASIMRKAEVAGDIGIEIEVEGNKFPKVVYPGSGKSAWKEELIPPMWAYHHDGSLRGNDNAEYVFKKPLMFDEVPNAIDLLWDMFKKAGSVLDDSNRTSVHIHLNAQKWHLNRLCAFTALYFSVEELLTEWCGDHRVGNLFCLRAKDAPAIVTKLKRFIQEDGKTELSEGLHYAGLNVNALCKFGSIESRSLRGCTDPQTILDWVGILRQLYEESKNYPDPRGVVEGFSGEGPMAYLHRILGKHAVTLCNGVNWDNQRIMESLYEGIRLAQDLTYCREWSEFEPLDLDSDPFKRDIKKVAASLTQQAAQVSPLDTYYASLMTSDPWPALSPTGASLATFATAYNQIADQAVPAPTEMYVPEPDSYEEDYEPDWGFDEEI